MRTMSFLKEKMSIEYLTAVLLPAFVLTLLVFLLTACGAKSGASSYTPSSADIPSSLVDNPTADEDMNAQTSLSVPTYITQIDGTYFIADCYHNEVIWSDTLNADLSQWHVLTGDVSHPHTIAGDGTVYLTEDTENNRVLIFEKKDGEFVHTQTFENIGNRPHFSTYDKKTDTFYVWSSMSGEMYLFRHPKDSTRMYLTKTVQIPELNGKYIRSFTIVGDEIYFPSGICMDGSDPFVLRCDLATFSKKKEWTVPAEIAGMAQIVPIGSYYYVTVSTDSAGNQDAATILRAKSLDDLSNGQYEDIYSQYFKGGGTPYALCQIGDDWYLTEHRLPDHAIWQFKVTGDKIKDVKTLF